MKSAVATFVAAVVLTALLTPLVRRAALAAGVVDEPGARRVHLRRVPRMGGIAIVVGFFVPLLALLVFRTGAGLVFFATSRIAIGLIVGTVLVGGVGLVDDIRVVGAKNKLFVQLAAATVTFACGMRIDALALPWVGTIQLGWLAFPATIGWVVGIINAINLIDGLDGLAAGVSFFACVTNFVIALLTGNVFIQLITASLAGALIGFLFHNFNPARIFMGDSGSMFLGFILAAASLLGSGTQKSPTLIAILVPLLALGLPITDLLLTIVRRFLAHRSLFSADRGHIHHRLLDLGLTHRRAVLSLYMVSVAFTAIAFLVYFGRSWEIGAALLALTAVLVGIVQFAGYFNSSLVALGQAAGEELAETLRRSVPHVLRSLADASSCAELPVLLAQFGEAGGLLALGIVNSKHRHLQHWRWESPRVEQRVARDAVCAKFAIAPEGVEIQFFADTSNGTIGPRMRILLQLVADGVERVLRAEREALEGSTLSQSERIVGHGA